MFKFAKQRIVTWPISVRVPRSDGSGQVDEEQCKLTFRLYTESERMAAVQMGGEDLVEDLIGRISGWEDIADQNGEALPFDKDTLRALMNDPPFAKAVAVGVSLASVGAAAKN